jgi:hypothetical protein
MGNPRLWVGVIALKNSQSTRLHRTTSPQKQGGSKAGETFAFSSGGNFSGYFPKNKKEVP